MNLIKVFLKNINVLNLLLLVMAIFLFFELDDSLIDKKNEFTISKPKEVLIASEEKAATESTATYLDYAVITEKNLFHPKRIMISEKTEEQLAKPEIILYGTLITDDKRVAYIEDKKNPYSTPGRGTRQVAVNEGGMIAGYKLAKVNTDSIVLVHGEDKITITLNIQKERKSGEATAKTMSPVTVPYSTSGPIPSTFQPQSRPTQPNMPPLPPRPARPTLNSR
ncbi:hypothetical protein DS62_07305 [Smithella sp. SC_K08D17]|jgi:hypothetical protein|nr:hypothetical protein KD27_04545 [Smithella sp. D17]KIE17000.1 hypothetical protein DS62_07305 [Smithella sp. SC_K08D17]